MRKYAALLVCALFLCSCDSGVGAPGDQPLRQITVTGTGTASSEPDVATIVFGVDVTSADPAEAVSSAASLMNSGLLAARDLGVAGEDIKTFSYSLWIENVYDPVSYQPTGERIYHVSQYESVDVRDVSKVGEVLAGVVGAGVNSVSSVSFGVEDQSALLTEARAAALADASQKAAAIAEGLGVRIGGPVSVSEYTGSTGLIDTAQMNYRAGYGESAPPVTPGSFTVNSSVTVSFEIQTD